MKWDLSRTITAVSSGIASGRRAIVRISGKETLRILCDLLTSRSAQSCGGDISMLLHAATTPRMFPAMARIHIGPNMHPNGIPVTCYWWPDARSFTGETSAELHLLGSLPLVECLVEELLRLGACMSERGEFALRSFMAGKLDLTQVEAVLGVIEADDEQGLSEALSLLAGNLSQPVRALRNELLELTAHLEAGLDFVDEDIEFISVQQLTASLSRIQHRLTDMSSLLFSRGVRVRFPRVVLAGLPNAGKSTLFNLLAGESRAIVSEQAGTTRDAVTARVIFGNTEVELVDTAGLEELRESSPRALAQGVLQASLASADLIVFCVDQSGAIDRDWLRNQCSEFSNLARTLVIGTKSDLSSHQPEFHMEISRSNQATISRLALLIESNLTDINVSRQTSAMHHTMIRCRQSIEQACECLEKAIDCAVSQLGEELVASELHLAIDGLSSIIGDIHTEDILGQIFSRFCIGK